jgi:hypothetical protein
MNGRLCRDGLEGEEEGKVGALMGTHTEVRNNYFGVRISSGHSRTDVAYSRDPPSGLPVM